MMKNPIGAVEVLLSLLNAIEEDGCGMSWSPYCYACERWSPEMSEAEAREHIASIVTRWQSEGCALPVSGLSA